MIKFWEFSGLICFLFFFPFFGTSQTLIEIVRNQDQDKEFFTKEIFNNYKFFLLVEELVLPVERISDSLLLGPILDSITLEKIKNDDYVVVQFQNEKHCFITQFPNVFIESRYTGNKRELNLFFFKASNNFGIKLKMIIILKSIFYGKTYCLKNFQRIDLSFIDNKNRNMHPFVYYCEDYYNLFIRSGKKPFFI
jgi:hypothetical protein